MRRALLLFVLILSVVIVVYSQPIPWKERGRLRTSLHVVNDENLIFPFDPGSIFARWDSTHGRIPSLVLYENAIDTTAISVTLSYYLYTLPSDTFWWADTLTIGMITQPFQLHCRDLSSGTTASYSFPALNPELISPAYDDSGSWAGIFTIPATQLPGLSYGTMQQYWVAPTTTELPWNVSVDTLTVYHGPMSSPPDSLFWIYHNWDQAMRELDPLVINRFSHLYPDDTRLARNLFWRYYQASQCDSLSLYADRLRSIWENDRSHYLVDFSSSFDFKLAFEDLDQRVHDVCVADTTYPVFPLGEIWGREEYEQQRGGQ